MKIIQLPQDNPLYTPVFRDFKRWSKDQKFIHTPGMVGQTERPFPCKAASAIAVYDHDMERFTYIRVMLGYKDWRVIELD
jgi:hypothetical protein